MPIVVPNPPAGEPISLVEAKAQLRVTESDEDTYISGLISAAREQVESDTGAAWVVTNKILYLDAFPSQAPATIWEQAAWGTWSLDALSLVRPLSAVIRIESNLMSVESVTYLDTSGVTQTLGTDVYVVDTFSRPGRIAPAYGKVWPASRTQLNSVAVAFTSGKSASQVPAKLKLAMKMLVAHWFENREPVTSAGGVPKELQLAYEDLIATWRDFSGI